MNKSVDKSYRASTLGKPAQSRRHTYEDIDQEKIYQQTKDDILFWSKKLRVSPSQLFTLPEDHLDELLAAAYEETIRHDMHQKQIKRMEDLKRLEEIQQLEEMQRQEELQRYEHMKRLEEIQKQEEMQMKQKMTREEMKHLDDYNRQEGYQRQDDLDAIARGKRMEELQRQEELERQKEIQRLEKIQIQKVLQQKQQRREQRIERLEKLSQIKNQFIEQQSPRLKGGSSQLSGRSAWEILHDAALEIEASYGPMFTRRLTSGGIDMSLPPLGETEYEYEENSASMQNKAFDEQPTFHINNAKFDITLPKT